MERRIATIRLPYPPSVNHYWVKCVRFTKNRKPYVHVTLGRDGERYRVDVQAAVLQEWGLLKRTKCRIGLTIVVHAPDHAKRDLDNLPKAVLDGLTHARCWEDDSQVDDLRIVRGCVAPPEGYLDVTFEQLTDEPLTQKELI